MQGEMIIILIVPLLGSLALLLLRHRRLVEVLNVACSLAVLALSFAIAADVRSGGPVFDLGDNLYADALSAIMAMIIGIVSFSASLYSIGYMGRELDEGKIDMKTWSRYFPLFQMFVFSMLLVVLAHSIAVMWIAIEGTTIVSALLVGLYNKKTSLEAAWKYLIICTVGIAFALLGNILIYSTASKQLPDPSGALDFTKLVAIRAKLDPDIMKLAYVLILIGYGTKAGMAPLHNWLPDAHSEAPTPVSALLSGVLLKCALYGIIRVQIIAVGSLTGNFTSYLLIFFGLLSLGMAAGFIALQKDVKRLLAYSSVEHVGIILLALGIGGYLGIFAAIFHMVCHAMTKALMFFTCGNMAQKYGTKDMTMISGAFQAMPLTATMFVLASFALLGSPPFALFISEFALATEAVRSGHYVAVGLFLLFLAIVFACFVNYGGKMTLGKAPGGVEKGDFRDTTFFAMLPLIMTILALGLFLPAFLRELIEQVAAMGF